MSKLDALDAFFYQRSGIEWRDYYSDWRDTDGMRAYRQDRYEHIDKPRKAYKVLRNLANMWGVISDDMVTASKQAFSGRLSFIEGQNAAFCNGEQGISYCTGQYFPTEYRHAAVSVLLRALKLAFERNAESYGEEVDYQDFKRNLKGWGFTQGMLRDYGMA